MTRSTLLSLAALTGLTLSSTAWAGGDGPWYTRDVGALDPQECGNGCWTNHLRVTDFDGDGDLDIILANYADFFQGTNSPEPLALYTNDGAGNFTNVSATAVGGYSGNLRQVAVGDVDGDGAVDIYGADGIGGAHVLFMNDGNGVFTDEADTRLPADDYPASGAARMADIDNDGDLDIFAADAYAETGPPWGQLYINDGLGMFTLSESPLPDSYAGRDTDDVEFADVDRDFDLDILLNAHEGGIGALWLNDGSGNFTAGGSLAPPATTNFHYNMAPCDVDGDGDLDLWVDNIGGAFTEQLQINDGSGNFTDETAARVTGNPTADDNGVVCLDIDDDGDLDGVVMSLSTPERLLENDGNGNFTYVPGRFPGPEDPPHSTLWGEFGDLDGDNRSDLVTGQGEILNSDEVDFATTLVPQDSTPPLLIAVENPGTVPAGTSPGVRFAVSDRTVTDQGPRLSRAWAVVDPDGAATEIDATFMGGDLFRAALPAADDGSVTYQVCATDRAGNTACSDNETYDIGDAPPGGSDSGGSDSGDSGNGEGPDDTADSGSGVNPPTSGGDASGTGETETDPGANDDGDGSGCSCRTNTNSPGLGFLLLIGLIGLRTRQSR